MPGALMIDLVVDSSVAIKWFVPETFSAEADRILLAHDQGALAFTAPEVIYAEFGNIVWKKHLFQGLSASDADFALARFQQLNFSVTSDAALLDEAYRLAVMYKRTVYDSLYLALSLRVGCQFVTADERLVNAVGATFSNVIWLANWP